MQDSNVVPETTLVPAPWRLEGRGFMLLYRFSKAFEGLSIWSGLHRRSRFGAVMVVDYSRSDAGPYRELLFLPGHFRSVWGTYPSITKIYVSTLASIVNGRANWGIPKERADFTIEEAGRESHITVSREGETFAELVIARSGPCLPIHLGLIPRPLRTIGQPLDGTFYRTTPSGKGWVQRASLRTLEIDAEHFPDVGKARLLAAIAVPRFELVFPEARRNPLSDQST